MTSTPISTVQVSLRGVNVPFHGQCTLRSRGGAICRVGTSPDNHFVVPRSAFLPAKMFDMLLTAEGDFVIAFFGWPQVVRFDGNVVEEEINIPAGLHVIEFPDRRFELNIEYGYDDSQ